MGTDIHAYTEVRENGAWTYVPYHPFTHGRSYAVFGFIAGVRNYSHSPVIAEHRGVPKDAARETCERFEDRGYHSVNWLSLKELLDYDYDQIVWDRRVTKQTAHNVWDGAALAEEGEGRHIPLRELLGPYFFNAVAVLQRLGAPEDVRIVFGFDS